MSITGLKALQISKMVDHILRTPGNVRAVAPAAGGATIRNMAPAAGAPKGNHLEMTVVVVSSADVDALKEDMKAVVDALKRSNEIFRNVRLNFVRLKEDGGFENQVIPLIYLQTGKCFETENCFEAAHEDGQKAPGTKDTRQNPVPTLASLCAYLKKFHARSKVVLVFANEEYAQIPDKTGKNDFPDEKEILKEALNPFLKQKLLLIMGEEVVTGTQLFMKTI